MFLRQFNNTRDYIVLYYDFEKRDTFLNKY